ncbi:MAG TPA: glutathione peroxidase [Chitinophagaceae bacterium]
MKKLKKAMIILLMLIIAFAGYVEIVNLNSTNMTYRQKVLKAVYPVFMWLKKLTGKNSTELSNKKIIPPVSFYSLKGTLNNGEPFDFAILKGKKILLVNTASDCGYTDQYNDLQKLYEQNIDKLIVIGFPANDFKEQEKGTDEEIAQFCKANFGVSFPLMKKSSVIKEGNQNPVFQWLTDTAKNGWNNKPPSWNFAKYLVNEEGILINYFGPSVSPVSKDVTAAINN